MATVPTPSTQVAGTPVPAATVNSQGNLANYLAGRVESGGARKPLARLRATAVQSIPNNAFTSVTFDTETFDYDNSHTTTSRYTAGTAGVYLVSGQCGFVGNATGARDIQLAVNGTAYSDSENGFATVPNAGNIGLVIATDLVQLNVGDYLELQVFQSSGGALNTLIGGAANPRMTVMWVSVLP